jgi:hypothetical protein
MATYKMIVRDKNLPNVLILELKSHTNTHMLQTNHNKQHKLQKRISDLDVLFFNFFIPLSLMYTSRKALK